MMACPASCRVTHRTCATSTTCPVSGHLCVGMIACMMTYASIMPIIVGTGQYPEHMYAIANVHIFGLLAYMLNMCPNT